jgi:Na+-driven multidrug efflux pump
MSDGDEARFLGRRERMKQQRGLSESLLSEPRSSGQVGFTIGHSAAMPPGGELPSQAEALAAHTPLVRTETRHSRTGDDGIEQERSETALLWDLGWPLLIGRIADEISWLLIFHYWGMMGTAYSGAGYDAYSGMQFSLVFIFGAQQALYTMVPQATGAGNEKQVGVLLQVVLLWTTIIMGLPTALSWAYMGELMQTTGMLADAPADCGVASSASVDDEVADQQAMNYEAELISSYGVASNLYLLPYIWVVGLTTWLESIEIVQEAELIAAMGSLAKAGLSCLFMFHVGSSKVDDSMKESNWKASDIVHENGVDKWPWVVGYQLNGFAYASTVAYTAQLALLLWVVFIWKRHHEKYWRGWDLPAALNPELNKRFLTLAAPLIVQYAMQNWAWFIIQMIMSSECEDLSSAYGVTSSFTNTAGSVSTALYTAISVRVGTNLGEGRPLAAERVMKLGFAFGAIAGGTISLVLYLLRVPLAGFFSDDAKVNHLSIGVAGQVSLYYFLNSMMWAFWAPLEGQMRTMLPSAALTFGMWGVTVPLTYATIKLGWLGVEESGLTDCGAQQCASNCGFGTDSCTLAEAQLSASWWVGNLGMLTTMGLMLWACLTSDWQELSKLAQESAEIIEGDEGEALIDSRTYASDPKRGFATEAP